MCKDGAQDVQGRQGARRRRLIALEIGQVEGVDMLDRAGEVSMHLEAGEVADDEERRVLQVLAVLEELLVGGRQVLALALVLPADVAAFPDIGPPSPAASLAGTALEGVVGAVGVGGRRRRLTEHGAEVEEVLLGGAALGERATLPRSDERRQVEM